MNITPSLLLVYLLAGAGMASAELDPEAVASGLH
jgi:hypothetical protein